MVRCVRLLHVFISDACIFKNKMLTVYPRLISGTLHFKRSIAIISESTFQEFDCASRYFLTQYFVERI